MVATQSQLRDIQKEGLEGSNKMTISQDNEVQSHIIKVLTENYKYPIASLIREGVSNAWDSHVMSNKQDTPIPVKLFKDLTGNYALEMIDEGLGLDEEGFYKYYMKLGESNKRGVAGVLGYYGCGAKSALAYTDSYEVVCRKDGTERSFLIYKGEDTPECTKVYERPTTEVNGVKIKVPVNRYDYSEFVKAIKQQLCYFPTVAIQIEGDSFNYLEAKIFENDLFSWSEIYPSNEMHINFGGVHYPIDWDLIKISKINVAIGIKIAPDKGVNPFFNRESLQYTALAKEEIKGQICKVAEYFVNKYNENWKEETNITKCWEKIGLSDKFVELAGETFRINQLMPYSSVSPKELSVKDICLETPNYYKGLESKILQEYKCIVDYESYKWRIKHLYKTNLASYILDKDYKLIEVDNIPTGRYKKWLLQKYSGKILFIKKTYQRQLGKTTTVWNHRNDEDFLYLLKLSRFTKEEKIKWRPLIKEYQLVENQFKSLIINEVGTETSDEYLKWLENYKEELKAHRKQYGTSGNYKGLNKGEQDITIAYYKRIKGYKYSPKKEAFKITDLHKNPYLTVYETANNPFLYNSSILCKMFPKVKFALIGKNEVKKLPKLKGFKTIQEFMSQLTKPFVKVVTANKVNAVLETYNNLKSNDIVENVLVALHKDVKTLEAYKKEYYFNMDEEVSNSIYEYAKENNIWDREIMEVIDRVEKGMKDYEFISILETPRSYNHEETEKYKRFINQMLLFKKLYNKKSLPEYDLVLREKKEELVLEEAI